MSAGVPFSARGGAKAGGVSYSWPLAALEADASRLQLRVWFPGLPGNYLLAPHQVTELSPNARRFGGYRGIRIHHTVAEYPRELVFWSTGNPEKLLAGIAAAGFRAEGKRPAEVPPEGMAFRKPAIAALFILWNGAGLFTLLNAKNGHFTLGLSFAMLVSMLGLFVAALCLPAAQRLVLKPGRHIGEVRPLLHLVVFILTFMSLALGLLLLLGKK